LPDISLTDSSGNSTIQSFNKAKKILLMQIYHDQRITFYCGCEFTLDKKISNPNGYVDSKGKSFKGRNCTRKMVIKFRYMENDMYNLVPAVGEINGLRSDYSFATNPGEKREFGLWDMEIENGKAEPRSM
jgi:deoxyribonuclease-1